VLPKMLYGTDWPILDRTRYEKRLAACGLNEAESAALTGGNAACLLDSLRETR
jgi:hypothetical protein